MNEILKRNVNHYPDLSIKHGRTLTVSFWLVVQIVLAECKRERLKLAVIQFSPILVLLLFKTCAVLLNNLHEICLTENHSKVACPTYITITNISKVAVFG